MTRRAFALQLYEMIEDFEWRKSKQYDLGEGWILARGTAETTHKPFKSRRGLYEAFAAIDNAQMALAFVRENGLLMNEPADLRNTPEAKRGERVGGLLGWAEWFRYCLQARLDPRKIPLDQDEHAELGYLEPISLSVPVEFGTITNFKLKLVPNTLLDALRYELAENLAGPGRSEFCRYCGKLFMTGTPKGPRHGSLFCSRSHAQKFNNNVRAGEYNNFGQHWSNKHWAVSSFGIECNYAANGKLRHYYISYTQLADLFPGREQNGVALWPVHIAAQRWADFPSFWDAFEYAIKREHVDALDRGRIDFSNTLSAAKEWLKNR